MRRSARHDHPQIPGVGVCPWAVLVLFDSPSPLLTRELVYTGITCAKARLDLWRSRALLAQAIAEKKTERYSGLAQRLGSRFKTLTKESANKYPKNNK